MLLIWDMCNWNSFFLSPPPPPFSVPEIRRKLPYASMIWSLRASTRPRSLSGSQTLLGGRTRGGGLPNGAADQSLQPLKTLQVDPSPAHRRVYKLETMSTSMEKKFGQVSLQEKTKEEGNILNSGFRIWLNNYVGSVFQLVLEPCTKIASVQ